jgi:hypothetical protein
MNQLQPPRTGARPTGSRLLPTLLVLAVVAALLVVAVVLFLNRSTGSGTPAVSDLPLTVAPVAASPTATTPPTATTAPSPTRFATPTASMIAPSNTPTPGEITRTATPVLSFATIEPVASPTELPQQATGGIKTVFVIMMENHNWSEIKDSPSAPYINQVLCRRPHTRSNITIHRGYTRASPTICGWKRAPTSALRTTQTRRPTTRARPTTS